MQYLEKTPQGYSILWEPSVGWEPMAWNTYLATRPTEPMTFMMECKLDNSFYEAKADIESTHFSLRVNPPGVLWSSYAFVVKESEAGKAIFQRLRDGTEHRMLLTIQFRDRKDEDCVWVRAVVSDRPYVYDSTMASRLTSPIFVPQEPPFKLSEIEGRWKVDPNVLGGRALATPEVRFRVTATAPITNLRFKIVYLETLKDKSVEVLNEDMQIVVSAPDWTLEKGLSKTVLSDSAKGYNYVPGASEDFVANREVTAEVYFSFGWNHDYQKLTTVPIANTIGP